MGIFAKMKEIFTPNTNSTRLMTVSEKQAVKTSTLVESVGHNDVSRRFVVQLTTDEGRESNLDKLRGVRLKMDKQFSGLRYTPVTERTMYIYDDFGVVDFDSAIDLFEDTICFAPAYKGADYTDLEIADIG